MSIPVNKFQTQLTDEYISSLKEECRTDLLDMINNVEFIQRLISPNRKYAKDLERDSSGRIKVDLVNPHILTDTQYFRQAAIHFQKHGCYTKLMPNPNPQSEYGQWLKREVLRCWNGMVRESDGEWITGDMYFYLNYFPIIQTKIKKGSKVGERVIDFPEMWEGVYWRFHYWHQARYGGMYDDFVGGKHCIEIASRGRSKSYSFGSKLTKNFVLGENELNRRNVKSLVAAYQKEYLIKDGTLNKFIDGITHCAKYTQFPSARLKASMSDLNWKAGFIDTDTQLEAGTLNEVLGVAVKDDSDKLRGKRSSWLGFEEFAAFAKFLETWQTCMPNVQEGDISFGQMSGIGCVCAGTKVWSKYGDLINIEDVSEDSGIIGFKNGRANIEPITYIQDEAYKQCVRITDNKGKSIECSIDHPILRMYRKSKRTVDYKIGNKRDFWNEYNFTEASKLKVGDKIMSISELNVFGNKSLFDARFVGMLIGDGSYGFDKTTVFSNCDDELNEYVYSKYDAITESSYITKIGKTYKETRIKGITKQLREIGIYGQTKTNKRLPVDFLLLNREDSANLIGGLFDTDGCVTNDGKRVRVFLTQSSEAMLYQIETLLLKFGVRCNIRKKMPREKLRGIKDVNPWYELHIESNESVLNFAKNIKLLCKYKQDNLDFIINNYTIGRMDVLCGLDGAVHSIVKKIEHIGVKRIYNLTAGDSNTYIANGFITHNTGGSSGSDFQGALEMLNYPDGYRVYSLPNFWDKGAQGRKKTVFFYPGYVNSKGYYNEDGVSDVVGALISEIEYRINLKYNSSDPLQLTRRKAETAFTIQDAIMKRDGSLYPTDKLNDVINEINLNPKYTDDMWIGRLSLSKNGEVEYKPDNDLKYITEFPHKDNKIEGACCIFKMPIKNSSGSVPWGRYIAGCDPYDDDSSDTLSLMSMFILDLWTDEIVFEYTGRPMFAEDAYENVRLALLMYNCEMNYENNKKGLFNHFSKHNSLYLLSDTLEFLKDKDMAKPGLYGNKQKGTANYGNGEKAIAPYARRCIRDYLLKSQSTNVFKEIDGETIQETISIFNYQNIKSKALLQELAMWSADGNYDRCIIPGTKILMDYGYSNIEDIKQNDSVITMDGNSNNVYLTHKNFNSKSIVEIGVLGQFNTLSCTENHPIFIKRYDKKPSGRNWFKIKNNIPDTKVIDASDVKIGDYVFIPKRKNLVDIGISNDLKYLLGWILGDGYISKSSNTVNIFFQGDQLNLAEKCKKIILENFNDSVIDSIHDYNWNGNIYKRHTTRTIKINPRITKEKNENMYKLNIQNKEFHSFVTKYISDSSNKTILKNTFNSNNMLWFFIGYFEADGHYRTEMKNDGSIRSNLSVVSTNYDEIIKIRQMLIDSDIWCSIRQKDASIYNCKRTNKKYQTKESYNIEVCGMHSIDIISNSLKFKHKGLPIGGNRNSFLKTNDGYWVPVNSLSKANYSGPVYNLSVENNNTYIANGITTHNCDALAMLMLLREDKLRLLGDTSPREAGANKDIGYLGRDEFFEKNYRGLKTGDKLKF